MVVVTPDAASGKKSVACPTIYLLHGYGGNAKTWIDIKPNLPQIADEMCIRDRFYTELFLLVRVRLIYYFTLMMS